MSSPGCISSATTGSAASARAPAHTGLPITGFYTAAPIPSSQSTAAAARDAAAGSASRLPLPLPEEASWKPARLQLHHVQSSSAAASSSGGVADSQLLPAVVDAEWLYARWQHLERTSKPTANHVEFIAAHAEGTPRGRILTQMQSQLHLLPTMPVDALDHVSLACSQACDLLSSVLFNSLLTRARSCSWCGARLELKDCCQSHILPKSMLEAYRLAFPNAPFLAEQHAEADKSPADFHFRHHCVTCDNLMGSNIEGPFSDSPLFKQNFHNPAFLLGLRLPASLEYNKSLYPFLLLIVFREAYLHLTRADEPLQLNTLFLPEWQLLQRIRAHLFVYSRQLNQKQRKALKLQECPHFTIFLVPLPSFQACAYSGRDRVDKEVLLSLFTAVSASFHRHGNQLRVCVPLAPFMIVVESAPAAECAMDLQPYRVTPQVARVPSQPIYLPWDATTFFAPLNLQGSDQLASFLIRACASACQGWFTKVQGLLGSWWSTLQPPHEPWSATLRVDERITIVRAPSRRSDDGEMITPAKLARLCEMFRTLLVLEFAPGERTHLIFEQGRFKYVALGSAAPPIRSDMIATVQQVVAHFATQRGSPTLQPPLDALFHIPPLRSCVQQLRVAAMRGESAAQLLLARLLFDAFNLHQGWHHETGELMTEHRGAEHLLAAREAAQWLRRNNSAAAFFLLGRLHFWHYGLEWDETEHSQRLGTLLLTQEALKRDPNYLPALVEQFRVLTLTSKLYKGRPLRVWLPQLTLQCLSRLLAEFVKQGQPEFAADIGPEFNFFKGAFGCALAQFLHRGLLSPAPLPLDHLILRCYGCGRLVRIFITKDQQFSPEFMSVTCRCNAAFFCPSGCRSAQANPHAPFCLSAFDTPRPADIAAATTSGASSATDASTATAAAASGAAAAGSASAASCGPHVDKRMP